MSAEPSVAARKDAERPGAEPGPVFIAAPDRSGTTLMFALLASHPNVSMVRRTNMWRYFHRRYGDLREPGNLDRCLGDMLRYRRMQHLDPDEDRIRREFAEGDPTYGRLFSLFHLHHAERAGKHRWGDKSLHTEHYADRVFAEYPGARIVHMVRDPRDRYASVRKRHGRDVPRVGAATARWLMAYRAARRNVRRYPGRYLLIRYEDLAREPEGTLRRVCAFIGEDYTPEMLAMDGLREGDSNSSFGDIDVRTISTKAIGRYRDVLSPEELRFIELLVGGHLDALGYVRSGSGLEGPAGPRFVLSFLPVQLARMLLAGALERIDRWRGEHRPAFRFDDEPDEQADAGGAP